MNDIRTRLTRCFAAVFPDLPGDQIEAASIRTVKGWDSIALVTLISLVEEEFACSIALEQIPNLESFEKFHQYLAATRET
jgi:acyl carrier protein